MKTQRMTLVLLIMSFWILGCAQAPVDNESRDKKTRPENKSPVISALNAKQR